MRNLIRGASLTYAEMRKGAPLDDIVQRKKPGAKVTGAAMHENETLPLTPFKVREQRSVHFDGSNPRYREANHDQTGAYFPIPTSGVVQRWRSATASRATRGESVGWSALLGICLPFLFHQADEIAVGVTKESDP